MAAPAKFLSEHAATVTASLVRSVVQFTALAYGVSVAAEDVIDPDARVASADYEVLVVRCATASGDRFFGLRLGTAFRIESLGALGFLLVNSRDLRHALERYQNFQRTVGDGIDFQLQCGPKEASIRLTDHAGSSEQRHRVESFASAVLQAARGLVGAGFSYLRVTFAHPLEAGEGYRECLGLQPKSAEQTVLVFESDWLRAPIRGADTDMARLIEGELSRRVRSDQKLISKVRSALASKKTDTWPSASEIARSFGLSLRTLQAKLSAEGSSFREVHDELRRDLAVQFLRSGDSLGEIAFALHFNEPAAFSRAFKRWTGMSPGQYRKKLG